MHAVFLICVVLLGQQSPAPQQGAARPLVERSEEGYVIRGNERTLEEAEGAYAEMPALEYEPPGDRWRHLKKTRNVLREGGVLRGDARGQHRE